MPKLKNAKHTVDHEQELKAFLEVRLGNFRRLWKQCTRLRPKTPEQFEAWKQVNYGLPIEALREYLRLHGKDFA